jgi:PKD repeat protein
MCHDVWTNGRIRAWRNPVSFTAETTILPIGTSYEDYEFYWDFGDGNEGRGLKIEHDFYNANRNYRVTLTVKHDDISMPITKTVVPRPYSPNIYLYREKPAFDIVSVIVDGRVTKTVPKVPLGSAIIWDNVLVLDGKLFYRNKEYDFLYYEELLNEPKTSKYGWILERDEKGKLYLNDKLTTLEMLKDFFRGELKKAGLFKNEIEDFIDEWLGEGARLFPGKHPFRYAIMYIPENDVEDLIQIKTARYYGEIIRFHLLVQPAEKGVKLIPPKYREHERRYNVLHEWGVYSGKSLLRNTRMDLPDAGFANLFYGNVDYQTGWTSSTSFGEKDPIPFDQQSPPFQDQETQSPQEPSGCSRYTPHSPSSPQEVNRNLPWPFEDPPP